MGFLSDRKLKKRGLAGTGTVAFAQPLNQNPESAVVPMKLRLKVEGDGRPEREVDLKATISRGRIIGAGTVLAVKVDSGDPGRVAIDWDETDRMHADGHGLLSGAADGTDFAKALGRLSDGHRDVSQAEIQELTDSARRLAGQGGGGQA